MAHVILDADKRILHVERKTRPLTPAETTANYAIHEWPHEDLGEIRIGHQVTIASGSITGYSVVEASLIADRRSQIHDALRTRVIEYLHVIPLLGFNVKTTSLLRTRTVIARILKTYAASNHDANLADAEQTFAFAANQVYPGADFTVEPGASARPQITTAALLNNPSDTVYFGQFRLYGSSANGVDFRTAGARSGGLTSRQDLSDAFETGGEIELTFDGETIVVALTGADRTEPYRWQPTNLADTRAFAARHRSADGGASITLRVPSDNWRKLLTFAQVDLVQWHKDLDLEDWSGIRSLNAGTLLEGAFDDDIWRNDASGGGVSAPDSSITVPVGWRDLDILEVIS